MLPNATRFVEFLISKYADMTVSQPQRSVEKEMVINTYRIYSQGAVIGTYEVHTDFHGSIKRIEFNGYIPGHTSVADDNKVRLWVTHSKSPWDENRTNGSFYRHDHHYSISFVDDEKDGDVRKDTKEKREQERKGSLEAIIH